MHAPTGAAQEMGILGSNTRREGGEAAVGVPRTDLQREQPHLWPVAVSHAERHMQALHQVF